MIKKPKKLENRSVKGIFIGYDRRSPAYLIYFPETLEVKKIRCVQFQMDVKTAYLNAPIDCELYEEQPEGYIKTNKQGEKLVWKLKKSLYGLKQSGRNWNNLLHGHLTDDGFS